MKFQWSKTIGDIRDISVEGQLFQFEDDAVKDLDQHQTNTSRSVSINALYKKIAREEFY